MRDPFQKIAGGIAVSAAAWSASAKLPSLSTIDDGNSSAQTVQLRGSLSRANPPAIGTPIPWVTDGAPFAVILGGLGAAAGIAVGMKYDRKLAGALTGLALGAAGGALCDELSAPMKITFETQVLSVLENGAPYVARIREGKSARKVGPLFPQNLTIPECDCPLNGLVQGGFLTPGQKIRATFYLDAERNITGWHCVPSR